MQEKKMFCVVLLDGGSHCCQTKGANLLGCDHWVLAGTPRPKIVGFYHLAGVAIAPVSKKLALKMSNMETLLKESGLSRMGFPLVLPGFKTLTQPYLRPYCQACKKEAFICSLIFFCSYSTYLFPCPNWVKTSFMYTYTQYLTSICFSKNKDVHTKESLG